MVTNDKVRATPFFAYPVSRTRSLLYLTECGVVTEVDSGAAAILMMCRECRTVEEHTAAVSQAHAVGDPAEILHVLQALLQAGLLRSCDDIPGDAAADQTDADAPITTVGVITADRPSALRRCLESFIRNCQAYSRQPRFLVVDGSQQDASRVANCRVIDRILGDLRYPVEYMGAEDVAEVRVALVREGASEAAVDFALRPTRSQGAAGPQRNLLSLLTVSEKILSVDDDVRCLTWELSGRPDGLLFCGHIDPRESYFFCSRLDALATTRLSCLDLLGTHEALLGRSLASLARQAGGHWEVHSPCEQLVRGLTHGAGRVRVTLSGLAGDSGVYCPYRLLFSSGVTRSKMAANRWSYETALSSREVLRIAARAAVTHDPGCMATCVGLDNRAALPPFVPLGRNEDGVFGATLSLVDRTAFFGHVPCGIVHDSHRPAHYDDQTIRSASETRISELIINLVRLCLNSMPSTALEPRMRRMGEYFVELGRMDVTDFIEFVTTITLRSRCRELHQVEIASAESFTYPEYWRRGLERYRQVFVDSAAKPEFFLPIEFGTGRCLREAFTNVQSFLRLLGELYLEWPTIVGIARGRRHRCPRGTSMPASSRRGQSLSLHE